MSQLSSVKYIISLMRAKTNSTLLITVFTISPPVACVTLSLVLDFFFFMNVNVSVIRSLEQQ